MPTSADAYASRVGSEAPGIEPTSCVVSSAADVPIIRPPRLVAKLPPVPRRCSGKTTFDQVAIAAGIVGLTVFAIALLATFFLPEPNETETQD